MAATWWKPSSDESEEKTSCCSFISWMLEVIVLWGGRKPLKISRVSLGAICLFAKPSQGLELGRLAAHYCLWLCPVVCGSIRGDCGSLSVPWCCIGMIFRQPLPPLLWEITWVLRGRGEPRQITMGSLPLESGTTACVLIKTTFVSKPLF